MEEIKKVITEAVRQYGEEAVIGFLAATYGIGDPDNATLVDEYDIESVDADYSTEIGDLLFDDYDATREILEAFVEGDWSPAPVVVQQAASAPPKAQPQAQPQQPAKKKVVYPDPRKDSFEVLFDDFDDLVTCNEEIEKTEIVSTHDEDMLAAGGTDTKHLTVKPVMDAPVGAAALAQKLNCDVDALTNTMRSDGGTGLSIVMGDKTIPVGWSAMNGLRDRAGFTEDGLMRHWRKSDDDAAAALNRQFANWDSSATVIERAGKIRSVMSDRFAYGKFSHILDAFKEFWTQKYPNAEVNDCYLNHQIVRWVMDLDAYKSDVFQSFPQLLQSGYKPELIFSVSNTGDSAFRVTPALGQAGSKSVVPIAMFDGCIAIRHTAKGNFTDRCNALMDAILASFAQVDTMLVQANANLEKMQNTTVQNAYNAVLRTMADCGIPKAQGMEAADNFKGVYGSGSATAFDCFLAVVSAYSYVVRDNPADTKKQFAVSMSVGKAANAPWEQRGNIPGDFSWN